MKTTTMPSAAPSSAAPPSGGTERPVPRWATVVARAIPLVGLPACLWRLPFAFGFTMGTVQEKTYSWWVIAPYVLTLSTVSECLALLSIGLVRGWGEVVPGWVPVIGGRRVAPAAAIVPAALGGLVLTGVLVDWSLGILGIIPGLQYTNDSWRVLAVCCQALMVLWGPLLLAVTYAYWVRRCR
ncbi:hypothetical protein [Kitasatospora sp. NPDC058190]|uniref:hypothetical protein n=1 Tax=Kitasatospora sp. NPDC058190 TaxID=3346371 RepID=UPI0036DAFA81